MSPLSHPPGPAALEQFPKLQLSPTQPLFRIHWSDRGPWWFSHAGAGRFDLSPPNGTCYLAAEPLGAFVEVFRTTPDIPEVEISVRRISTLFLPRPVVLAACTSRRARAFGITAAIHSSPDYRLTQAWGTALARAGFDGIRYLVSHDPAQRCVGIALFGPAGASDWPVADTTPLGADLLAAARRQFGIGILRTP